MESASWLSGVELAQLSDEAYYLRMRACGARSRQWDDRYIGLLTGAVDRDLPRRRGFRDIYHMAALQSRMSRKKVTEVLRVARAIRCCPGLLRLFSRAEVPWTKIRTVASLARPDWDDSLCELVRNNPRKGIEEWVRERARSLGIARSAVAHAAAAVGQAREGMRLACGEPSRAGRGSGLEAVPGGQGPVSAPVDASPRSPQETAPVAGARATAGPGRPDASISVPPSAGVHAVTPSAGVHAVTPSAGVHELTHGPCAMPAATSVADAAADAVTARVPPVAPGAAGSSTTASPPPGGGSTTGTDSSPKRPSRAAGADRVIQTLIALGVDPVVVQKLLLDREALAAAEHRSHSLVEVLERAIRSHKPTTRSTALPYLLVLRRCPECRNASIGSRFGPLPVDAHDHAHLRPSGRAVDLDRELEERGLEAQHAGPRAASPALAADERSVPSRPVGSSGEPVARGTRTTRSRRAGRSAAVQPARRVVREPAGSWPVPIPRSRPTIPARDLRFLMALHGGICAVKGCRRPGARWHHQERRALVPVDDVTTMSLICALHHRLLHSGHIENPEEPPDLWRPRTTPARGPVEPRKDAVDARYRRRVRAAADMDERLARKLAPEAADEAAIGDQDPDRSGDDAVG